VESGVEKLAPRKTCLVDPVTKLDGESHDPLKKPAMSKHKLTRDFSG
jgi:hypothetical protein